MEEEKPLSESEINLIAFDARDGKATEAEVRRLLELFRDLDADARPIPRRLIAYVGESLNRFLTGEKKSLEAAFGLKGNKGRPRIAEAVRMQIAVEVLRQRLLGETFEAAVENVTTANGSQNIEVTKKAWAEHWLDAIAIIRNERPPESYPWTEAEKAILEAIQHDRRRRSAKTANPTTRSKRSTKA